MDSQVGFLYTLPSDRFESTRDTQAIKPG